MRTDSVSFGFWGGDSGQIQSTLVNLIRGHS